MNETYDSYKAKRLFDFFVRIIYQKLTCSNFNKSTVKVRYYTNPLVKNQISLLQPS
jgi:hypothetical protein